MSASTTATEMITSSSNLCYLAKVGLRQARDGKYLSYEYNYDAARGEVSTKRLTMSVSHPFLKQSVQTQDTDSNEEFYLSCPINQEYSGSVLFGSQVHIRNAFGFYLVCLSEGELRVEKLDQESQQFSSGATLKSAKWTLLHSTNIQSKRPALASDNMLIKSPFGEYLSYSNASSTTPSTAAMISSDTIWNVSFSNVPYIPMWIEQQLSASYQVAYSEKQQDKSRTIEKKNLGGMSVTLQELYLIEDILYVMTGIEGNYIKRTNPSSFAYSVEPYLEQSTCEPSLRQLVNKILEVCHQHDSIQRYIQAHSQFTCGTISQALSSALSLLLREYVVMVNQLDAEFQKAELTLQKLWFYIQPSFKVMDALYKLTTATNNLRGGELIGQLFELVKCTSDAQIVDIYYYCLQKAFYPFAQMLSQWIYYGHVDDAFQEFFIYENLQVKKDNISRDFKESYWDQRFSVADKFLPSFLLPWRDIIFSTGKYLNVLSEHAGIAVASPFEQDLLQNYEAYIQLQDFSQPLQKAYEWANAEIMHLVVVDQDLSGRLRSIKNYFFLEKGDFFVHFLDSSEEELIKHVKNISREKLESLLEMSIRTSSLSCDPYMEDLSFEFSPYTLTEQLFAFQSSQLSKNNESGAEKIRVFTSGSQLHGMDIFTLDYKVKWPLNLILNRKTLTKYQLLFRYLFSLKCIERQLHQAWLLQQSMKELNVHRVFLQGYCITQRMLHYIKNLIYYVCFEVIECKWNRFLVELKTAQRFDDILAIHDAFLDGCLKESALLQPNLVNTLTSINQSCLLFAKFVQDSTNNMKLKKFESAAGNLTAMLDEKKTYLQTRKDQVQESRKNVRVLIQEKSYKEFFGKYQNKFEAGLKELMKIIHNMITKYDTYLINLIERLDFDGFYNSQWNLNSQGNGDAFFNPSNDKIILQKSEQVSPREREA